MLRQVLSSTQGVEIYSILALLVFLLFFTVMLIHTLRIPKVEEEAFSQLPLGEDDNIQSIPENDIKK
jgi:hypothetical protein